MPSIRIAIASLPQLLRDIVVGALSGQRDIELVGESSEDGGLLSLVRDSAADVVIVSCDRPEIEHLGRLVNGSPVTLLAITDEGRRGELYELRPRKVDLGELSPEVLVNAIRMVATSAAR